MKYVVVLVDGMADEPLERLDGKTPLAYAKTSHLDQIAPYSEIGMVHTIPEGCAKGSDTANLSVLGYDPKIYSSGRSALEALSMNVPLKETDITFRTNLVTVSDEPNYEDKVILDHSADEISTEEARELINYIANHFNDKEKQFFSGVSYRHLLVWDKGSKDVLLTPPHDILGLKVKNYKPKGANSKCLWEMTKQSYDLLKNHPINLRRTQDGLKPANSLWIWGEASKPSLTPFKEKYGLEGAVISAVDLIKGIGIGADMASIDVEGATGNVHTNYKGKTEAALKWLIEEDKDFVYIHLEGPDEAGHRGELHYKIEAMERIDQEIIGPILNALDKQKLEYSLMVLPDHPTPLSLRTHTGDSVPYLIYRSGDTSIKDLRAKYNEQYARKNTDETIKGHEILTKFIFDN